MLVGPNLFRPYPTQLYLLLGSGIFQIKDPRSFRNILILKPFVDTVIDIENSSSSLDEEIII